MFSYLVYCIRPFIRKSLCQNVKTQNHAVIISLKFLPKLHPRVRTQFFKSTKRSLLICPHCNKVFQTNLKAVAD